MKPTILLLVFALATFAQSLSGTWLTPEGRSKVEIKPCGATHCGTIVWMQNPKNDEKNADPTLRARPLLGVQILNGDKLYAPERGKTVDAKFALVTPDSLEIRVSLGLVKKTVTWTRVK
jgi:uncharacterized protein (DUF2147 family)